ncbi:MAG: glycosyltransferase family 2 protein [Burkholderiales bacterium]|nr:glycosyltransferase family 2 protein [Burkholderiales bacterium]
MRVSVIVSTYNRPRALDRVLHGLAEQRLPAAEVLVADDGSTDDTRTLVQGWAARFPLPLRHVWHPDTGFRLAAIRNRAAAVAHGDWLQFIDGDCVPRPSFVARVARLAAPGWALAGDRILLSQALTERIERDALPVHRWGGARWLRERVGGGINRLAPLLHWPFAAGRGARRDDWRHLRGASIGIARADFERVNGFEEAFVGWGLEDSEFAIRLLNAGVRIRSGRLALALLHLWHAERPRDEVERNRRLLEEARASGRVRAVSGLAQGSGRVQESAGVHP